jgi:hypothetical protein
MSDERQPHNLGRGLSALFQDEGEDYASLDQVRQTKTVPVEFLTPGRFQPRHRFDAGDMESLVASIRERGVLQPILVRRSPDSASSFEIVAGERRWRAAQLAQLHEVPVLVREFSDEEALEVALPANLDAWRAIREFHSLKADKDKAYALTLHTGNTGWYESLAREYADIFSPCLKLTNYRRRPVPPKLSKKLKTSDLVQVEVDYSEGIRQVAVPDEYLPALLPKLKSSLEFAWDLESRRSSWVDICSIEPDEPNEDEGDSSFHRSYKLSGHVILFTDLFKRMAAISPAQALALLRSWPTGGRMWERLRVWAFGNLDIAPADEFADVMLALSRDAFWPFKGERDLLLGLSRRWISRRRTE